MARYRGSRIKVIRRLGILPGFTSKSTTRVSNEYGRSKSLSQYAHHLQEKQKLRYNYGVTEHELVKYVKKAKKKKGNTGYLLLQLLESRLDNLIYKSGLTPTINSARQLINHGHVFVNKKRVTIPGFHCPISTEISINKNSIKNLNSDLKQTLNQNLPYVSIVDNDSKLTIVLNNDPDIKFINFSINILLVLEYYSGK